MNRAATWKASAGVADLTCAHAGSVAAGPSVLPGQSCALDAASTRKRQQDRPRRHEVAVALLRLVALSFTFTLPWQGLK